jgi:YhfZ C-terminal domain/Helix-turn-helix domain
VPEKTKPRPIEVNSHLTRAGAAAAALARQLLVEHPGNRLPTVSEYASQLGTGVGTVQRALVMLEETGSIKLEPRGRLGTFLAAMDRPKLWETSQSGLLIGLMPLPYTRRYEGLATGLRASVEDLNIPFSLAFMSGAETRIKALKPSGNFAIVSKLAAQRLLKDDAGVIEVIDFGPDTFVEGHALVWAPKARRKHPRVGIDFQSLDQVEFAKREFGDDAELLDVPYLQVVDQLRAGAFDVAIWARDALREIGDLEVTDFTSEAARSVMPLNTTAALVAATGDTLTAAVLEHELDVERVKRIQAEVLSGERPPRY